MACHLMGEDDCLIDLTKSLILVDWFEITFKACQIVITMFSSLTQMHISYTSSEDLCVNTLGNPETGMTYFWITDSCPETVNQVKHKPPFEVISLAAAIASALQI